MAGFCVSLLKKAADSGLLSDVRALYLAPRVVLAPLRPSRSDLKTSTGPQTPLWRAEVVGVENPALFVFPYQLKP